jgi:hypothetical protein
MATVVKNFRIKSGLVVEGTSGTIDGHNILTESTSGDQYILNLVGGSTLVKSVDTAVFNVDGSGKLTINANTFDSHGSAADALSDANAYTDGEITTALSTAQGYANTAEQNAKDYTDNELGNIQDVNVAAYIENTASSTLASANSYTDNQLYPLGVPAFDSYGSATTAENNAKGYADSLINDASTTSTNVWSAYKTSSEIGVAVSNLVDSAPELLDTLNELAAAIADNPNYATDMAANLAAKQNTLTAGNGIDIASDTISVDPFDLVGPSTPDYFTLAVKQDKIALKKSELTAYTDTLYDATGLAAAAQVAAEATAQAALDDVLDGTTPFTDLNINDVAKQVAARTTSLGSVPVVAYQFNKSAFKSGKFLVKIDNGTHNEISEILVTLDSSDNVAITEYAIVGTNGSRGTITADVDSTHCRIVVDPVNDSTITVSGTVFNS